MVIFMATSKIVQRLLGGGGGGGGGGGKTSDKSRTSGTIK
jgi:hypothetical protein